MDNLKQQPISKFSKGFVGLKVLFLFGFIFLCGTFIFIKIKVNGDVNSEFNQTTRFQLGRYPFLRSLFALHNDGDARFSYFASETPIGLQYVNAQGFDISEEIIKTFAGKIQTVTGRPVQIFPSSNIKSGKLFDNDLKDIVHRLKRNDISGQPLIFVIYTEDFDRKGGEVGKTFQEYGIVLSSARLKEITQNLPSVLPEYIGSTLLHEFGHQIGLDHNSDSNCIMSEYVESPKDDSYKFSKSSPVDFCESELEEILKIKSKI